MKVIKSIDYLDGGHHYNVAEILEVKEYIVARISEVDEAGNIIRDGGTVWFPLENPPFELTADDIVALNQPDEPEVSEEPQE